MAKESVQPVQGLSYFSTDGGSRRPRSADIPRPSTLVRTDHDSEAEEYIERLRSKWPKFCNSMFFSCENEPQWDIRTFFDEYDFYTQGPKFLFDVVNKIMTQNERRLTKFCSEWSSCHELQWPQISHLLMTHEATLEIFHPEDHAKWGPVFLTKALNRICHAYRKAQVDEAATAAWTRNVIPVSTGGCSISRGKLVDSDEYDDVPGTREFVQNRETYLDYESIQKPSPQNDLASHGTVTEDVEDDVLSTTPKTKQTSEFLNVSMGLSDAASNSLTSGDSHLPISDANIISRPYMVYQGIAASEAHSSRSNRNHFSPGAISYNPQGIPLNSGVFTIADNPIAHASLFPLHYWPAFPVCHSHSPQIVYYDPNQPYQESGFSPQRSGSYQVSNPSNQVDALVRRGHASRFRGRGRPGRPDNSTTNTIQQSSEVSEFTQRGGAITRRALWQRNDGKTRENLNIRGRLGYGRCHSGRITNVDWSRMCNNSESNANKIKTSNITVSESSNPLMEDCQWDTAYDHPSRSTLECFYSGPKSTNPATSRVHSDFYSTNDLANTTWDRVEHNRQISSITDDFHVCGNFISPNVDYIDHLWVYLHDRTTPQNEVSSRLATITHIEPLEQHDRPHSSHSAACFAYFTNAEDTRAVLNSGQIMVKESPTKVTVPKRFWTVTKCLLHPHPMDLQSTGTEKKWTEHIYDYKKSVLSTREEGSVKYSPQDARSSLNRQDTGAADIRQDTRLAQPQKDNGDPNHKDCKTNISDQVVITKTPTAKTWASVVSAKPSGVSRAIEVESIPASLDDKASDEVSIESPADKVDPISAKVGAPIPDKNVPDCSLTDIPRQNNTVQSLLPERQSNIKAATSIDPCHAPFIMEDLANKASLGARIEESDMPVHQFEPTLGHISCADLNDAAGQPPITAKEDGDSQKAADDDFNRRSPGSTKVKKKKRKVSKRLSAQSTTANESICISDGAVLKEDDHQFSRVAVSADNVQVPLIPLAQSIATLKDDIVQGESLGGNGSNAMVNLPNNSAGKDCASRLETTKVNKEIAYAPLELSKWHAEGDKISSILMSSTESFRKKWLDSFETKKQNLLSLEFNAQEINVKLQEKDGKKHSGVRKSLLRKRRTLQETHSQAVEDMVLLHGVLIRDLAEMSKPKASFYPELYKPTASVEPRPCVTRRLRGEDVDFLEPLGDKCYSMIDQDSPPHQPIVSIMSVLKNSDSQPSTSGQPYESTSASYIEGGDTLGPVFYTNEDTSVICAGIDTDTVPSSEYEARGYAPNYCEEMEAEQISSDLLYRTAGVKTNDEGQSRVVNTAATGIDAKIEDEGILTETFPPLLSTVNNACTEQVSHGKQLWKTTSMSYAKVVAGSGVKHKATEIQETSSTTEEETQHKQGEVTISDTGPLRQAEQLWDVGSEGVWGEKGMLKDEQ